MREKKIIIRVTEASDSVFAEQICEQYKISAQERGVGIAQREPIYVARKMQNGDAVIAFIDDELAGFCYMEIFEDAHFVVHSGLIVFSAYRELGIAKKIKMAIFDLSKKKYPHSKIFGITTSVAVMKINLQLGYNPVAFSELTDSEAFWKGCKSCTNYDVLTRNNRKRCLCLGMIYDPQKKQNPNDQV